MEDAIPGEAEQSVELSDLQLSEESPQVVAEATPDLRLWLKNASTNPATIASAVVVIFAIGVGIWLRYRYYTIIEPGPDSDEAEMGLLARDLLRGEWPLLMRNQPYGGTPWLFGIAASIRVFGMNVFGLRLPTVFLGLINAGLAFGIGRQFIWSTRRSALAAAGVWSYPMAAVFFGSRETLYFVPAVTCSLLLLLVILRMERLREPSELLGSTSQSRNSLLVAGIAGGIGFWINPGSLYITAPTLLWIAVRAVREAWSAPLSWPRRMLAVMRPGFVAAVGLVLGAAPWLFLTILGDSRRNNYSGRAGYSTLDRLQLFIREQAPGWLGFRVPIGGYTNGAWLGGFGWKLACVALAGLLVFQIFRKRNLANETVISYLALGVPLIFLVVTAKSGPVYANLRYVFFASPILSLLLVAKWRRDLWAAAAVAVLPAISLAGTMAFNVTQAETVRGAVELLDSKQATCAITDYWAGGYRLMFESEERIVTVTNYENRDPQYIPIAAERGNCPWIFNESDPNATAVANYLNANGIAFEQAHPGAGLIVFFPERRVWVDEIFPDALELLPG